jgi:NAD(P)-dependent dehydrogenase (short-subunit alcohol dehydrogenase family)
MLEGRVIVVTGATAGIGAAIAEMCAQRGARVLITGRNPQRGSEVCRRIVQSGGEAAFLPCDATAPDSAAQAVEVAVARFGGLDGLVNNAGLLIEGTVLDCSDEDWDRVFAVNVTAVFRHARAAISQMRTQGRGGAIVNIASDWGLVGAERAAAYAASKGAVVQLTRAMAIDHARDRIRVNAVCPGDTDTAMLGRGLAGRDRARHVAELGAALPLGRVGTPRDVASAVVFLLSDESAFITGAALPVDGGNTAR